MNFSMTPRLGLDLGTGKTALAAGSKIVYCEPTLLVADEKTHRVRFTGKAAAERAGKLSSGMEVVKPVVRGAIADFAATRYHLRRIFTIAMKPPRVFRPMIVASVPISLNSVQERALCEAAREAGAGQIFLVPSNLASYVTVSSHISDPRGSLVVDIGEATTDISVMASNEIIVGRTINNGGMDLTELVRRVLSTTFGVETGFEEANRAKIETGLDTTRSENLIIHRKYKGSESGFTTVKVPCGALAEFMKRGVDPIIEGIVDVLEETPAELYEDIFIRGIFLTGGTARMRGLSKYVQERLNMKATTLEEPELSVIRGLGKILGEFNHFRDFFMKHSTF